MSCMFENITFLLDSTVDKYLYNSSIDSSTRSSICVDVDVGG